MNTGVCPWIENVSMADIVAGFHYDPGENSILIQIVDPDYDFPQPMVEFKEIYKFKFFDMETNQIKVGQETDAIDMQQANQLVVILKRALDRGMNVVVHCHAGLCRSGAVAEVGVMMGFTDTDKFRQPNLRVKKLMADILFNSDIVGE